MSLENFVDLLLLVNILSLIILINLPSNVQHATNVQSVYQLVNQADFKSMKWNVIVDKDGDGMKKAKLVAISMNVKRTISVIHLLFVKILMEVSLVNGKSSMVNQRFLIRNSKAHLFWIDDRCSIRFLSQKSQHILFYMNLGVHKIGSFGNLRDSSDPP